jgi:hypothetical protein
MRRPLLRYCSIVSSLWIAGHQAFVGDVQQGHARRFVDPATFSFDDAIFDLIARAEAVASTDAIRLLEKRKFIGRNCWPSSSTGRPSANRTRDGSRATPTSSRQCATPMIGCTMSMPRFKNSKSLASCVAPSKFESVE